MCKLFVGTNVTINVNAHNHLPTVWQDPDVSGPVQL